MILRKRLKIVIIFICMSFWYDAVMAQDISHPDFQFIRSVADIEEFELKKNGLRFLLKEAPLTPVVTLMVTYKVGSRHETDAFRGGAHLLEHMMFKGTPTHQKSKGTQIAHLLLRTGAFLNASTWKDGTNYYETLPQEHLETAIRIEADRMRNSLIRAEDLKNEMPVVQSEFDRMENSPYTALDQAVWAEAFQTHAYHYPIIGIRKDLEKMPSSLLKDFYDTYYWPNNAVIAVIGNFNKASLLPLLSDHFGKLDRSPHDIQQSFTQEPEQIKSRHVTVHREDPLEVVLVSHKIPPATHSDLGALDVLSFLLSRGKKSRLYQNLVDQNVAVQVFSATSKSYDPGLFSTGAVLTPSTSHETVYQAILDIYQQIKDGKTNKSELQRAKNQLHAEIAFSRDGSYAVGQQLSMAIAAGDWQLFSNYLTQVNKVTLEDVRRVANQYLQPSGMTYGYLISKSPEIQQAKKDSSFTLKEINLENDMIPDSPQITESPSTEFPAVLEKNISERIQQEQLRALEILSIKTSSEDIIAITGSFEGAGNQYAENSLLPSLTVALLDEGTTEKNKYEIAEVLENRGAQISFSLNHSRVAFHAQCLKVDFPEIMSLIMEQLKSPRFDADEFAKQKEQQKVYILQAMNNTEDRVHSKLSQLIYPENHPHYEIPYEKQLEDLEQLTLEEVKAFHKKHYGLQKTHIVVAGDVDHTLVKETVTHTLGQWHTQSIENPKYASAELSAEGTQVEIHVPDKVNVDVGFAHALAIDRSHEDYLPLLIANAILGGDFTARLSNTVRDEQGLTYSVYSQLDGIEKYLEGHWNIHIILNQKVIEKGMNATLEQIKLFVQEGITEQELEEIKNTLIGKYKVQMETTVSLAHQILKNRELDYELERLDTFPSLVREITVEKVNQVIPKWFHPDKLHSVTAGTLKQDDKKAVTL